MVLLCHFRLALSAAHSILNYGIVPQTCPWRSVLLLEPSLAAETLEAMRLQWQAVKTLERSGRPGVCELRDLVPLKDFVVYRELMEIHDANQWASCWQGLAYAHALVESITNTLGLENSFNDMRDAESRVTKNNSLSEVQRQGLQIRSIARRYPDVPQAFLRRRCRQSNNKPAAR